MKKWFWIAPVTVAADQAVKWYALKALAGGEKLAQTLIPGVLQLRYAENTGMAFSLFSGQPWLLGLASVVCILVGWLALRRYRLGPVSGVGAMLMLGGAVGNMLDRLLRGFVVDMFETLFVDFAVFNVADAALTVGAVLVAASLLFCAEEWKGRDAADGSDNDHRDG